jgi:hypothetical protein
MLYGGLVLLGVVIAPAVRSKVPLADKLPSF